MTAILEWLLDLRNIRLDTDRPLYLHWFMPYPAWIMFGYSLAALLIIAFVYHREAGTLKRRAALAGVRATLFALILAVICGPVLVLQRNRIEPATVVLLVDTSSSMNRKDTADSPDGSATTLPDDSPPSRLEQVRKALTDDDAAPLRTLLSRNAVRLVTFSSSMETQASAAKAEELSGVADAARGLVADGKQTDLFRALHEILKKTDQGPIAAIVAATDGQSTEPGPPGEAIELAAALKIPIHTLLLGSPNPVRDSSVGPVTADRNVFSKDIVAIRARIGASGVSEEAESRVRLMREEDGVEEGVQIASIPSGESFTEVEFLVRLGQPGRARYRVEVEPFAGEQELANNVDRVEINVYEDRLRVLYVEGYPRFEYRYLKNALLREETVTLSCLLLSADRDFAQEGDEPIRHFPETPDQLQAYDVVLFGDVDPRGDWWSPAQMELLIDFVSEHGGGFGLVAGDRHGPHRYSGTPLQKLLPVRIDPQFQGRSTTTVTQPYGFVLTPEGRDHRVFRFYEDPLVNARVVETLPPLYWAARTLGPRPGAEVLAEHPSLRTLSGPLPLAVIGRYGAGTIFFQATDDTWRWRRHTGEALFDAYYVQVVRALAPAREIGMDRRLRLRVSDSELSLGQTVTLTLEVLDAELLASLAESVAGTLVDASGKPVLNTRLQRLSPEARQFEAGVTPSQAGSFSFRLPDITPPAGEQRVEAALRVRADDLESLRTEANHELLKKIADETGGRAVGTNELLEVLAGIPDRSVRTPDDVTEPLWDSKLVLILFISIITVEWIIRKAFGML